jgi:hypothetical protein
MAYHMLNLHEEYREIGVNYLDQLDRDRTAKRLVKGLQALEYIVSVKEQPVRIMQDDQAISPSSLLSQCELFS